MQPDFFRLDASGWDFLRQLIKQKSHSPIGENLLEQWKTAGAKTVILDKAYIDRDFTEMFASFYSRTFKRHSKLCQRLFVFSCDFDDDVIRSTEPGALIGMLEEKSRESLLSIVTLRPVPISPINTVTSIIKVDDKDYKATNLIRSNLEKHLTGANISLTGLEMTQQDTRVGSCAQASIWTVARHFKNRHGGPWVATPEITKLATSRAGLDLSQSLPIGSDFLPVSDMIHTLTNLDREPYCYTAEQIVGGKLIWQSVNPAEVINRYLDSGIPLILGIHIPNEKVGHAIVASGRVRQKKLTDVTRPERTTAEFYSHVLVNDDQRGPNLFMRMSASDKEGPNGHQFDIYLSGIKHEICVEDHLQYIIVPLPSKVFFPAEKAETISNDLLKIYCTGILATQSSGTGINAETEQHTKRFVDAVNSGEAIFRTYLTYGWKYKKRALRNRLPSSLKVAIRDLELPKFVWVTEIGTFDSLSSEKPRDREIFSHAVIDATAKNTDDEAALLFHAPSYSLIHHHDNSANLPMLKRTEQLFNDKEGYFPKRRGEEDFTEYYKDSA